MATVARCLVCDGPGRVRYVKAAARYWECRRCGLLYQHPLPDPKEMQKFAEAEFSSGVYKQYVGARHLKRATFERRLSSIRRWAPGGRLLDVGCACGYMVEVALDAGYDAYGVEFAAAAVEQAATGIRPRIFAGDVESVSAEPGSFHVITAFDIVEHVHDPVAFLVQLRHLLAPGGLLALTTPDVRHLLRFVMQAHWPMLQPLQHTFLFSRRAMRLALDLAGLDVIRLGRATKHLTLDYLAGQVEDHTPTLYTLYRGASVLIPGVLRHWPLNVNIGEMFVLAGRRG